MPALKHFITDWAGSNGWSAMRRRRTCDMHSVWPAWAEKPIAGSDAIVPWSWNSLFGEADGSAFLTTGGSIFADWGAIVVANNWHLFDPAGPLGTGTPRLIFSNGSFSTFAVDLRIAAAANALADFIVDRASLAWIDGVHLDYYVNPYSLGASSFSDFAGAPLAAFVEDFDAGMARFAARLRGRMPNWILIAQLDHRSSNADLDDPLSGYYIEQYIGKFNPPQTSFATVAGWIETHAADMAIAHPGRAQKWVIEYRFPRVVNPALFSLTRDDFLAAHIDLCQSTGSYLSYDRDQTAHYAGHSAAAGKSTRTVILRPVGASDPNVNQFLPAAGGAGGSNWPDVSDQDLDTFARTTVSGAKDLYAIEPFDEPDVEGILDVSVMVQSAGINARVRPLWKSGGVTRFGNDHTATALTSHVDQNVSCPDGQEWSVEKVQALEAGMECTFASDFFPLFVAELEVWVRYEFTAAPASDVTGEVLGIEGGAIAPGIGGGSSVAVDIPGCVEIRPRVKPLEER